MKKRTKWFWRGGHAAAHARRVRFHSIVTLYIWYICVFLPSFVVHFSLFYFGNGHINVCPHTAPAIPAKCMASLRTRSTMNAFPFPQSKHRFRLRIRLAVCSYQVNPKKPGWSSSHTILPSQTMNCIHVFRRLCSSHLILSGAQWNGWAHITRCATNEKDEKCIEE